MTIAASVAKETQDGGVKPPLQNEKAAQEGGEDDLAK
jgi:hypothetical protein